MFFFKKCVLPFCNNIAPLYFVVHIQFSITSNYLNLLFRYGSLPSIGDFVINKNGVLIMKLVFKGHSFWSFLHSRTCELVL